MYPMVRDGLHAPRKELAYWAWTPYGEPLSLTVLRLKEHGRSMRITSGALLAPKVAFKSVLKNRCAGAKQPSQPNHIRPDLALVHDFTARVCML